MVLRSKWGLRILIGQILYICLFPGVETTLESQARCFVVLALVTRFLEYFS